MKNSRPLGDQPESSAGRDLTRREFFPRATAAALGAGVLLSTPVLAAPRSAPSGMAYRTLGKTGIRVSEIGFGSHLTKANMADPAERARQIRKGLELGINLFDIYEHRHHQFGPMGELLGPVRKNVVLSLVSIWPPTQASDEVDRALTALSTDVIDLYRIQLDAYGEGPMFDAHIEALRRAQEAGKIRAVGVVSHDHAALVDLLRVYPELDYVMFPYNFRHQKLSPGTAGPPAPTGETEADSPADAPGAPFRDCLAAPCGHPEFAGLVKETGVGLIAIKAFGGGALLRLKASDPWLSEQRNGGVSVAQAALQFVLQTPEIASTIPAMNSIAEIEENVGAVSGGGLSEPQGQLLRRYNEAADWTDGAYLPAQYRWLENWKA